MRTEDLIEALARDATCDRASVARSLAIGCAAGAGVAIVLFLATLGLRADFRHAVLTPWYVIKIVVLFSLVVAAVPVVEALARPGARVPAARLVLPALLLGLAIFGDLGALGAPGSLTRLEGRNGFYCITLIPMLAAAPLVGTLFALRNGAPTSPGLAGLAAGLLGGAIGGLLYALYCPDDSPLFVATWYPIGIGFVAIAGGLIGRAALRW